MAGGHVSDFFHYASQWYSDSVGCVCLEIEDIFPSIYIKWLVWSEVELTASYISSHFLRGHCTRRPLRPTWNQTHSNTKWPPRANGSGSGITPCGPLCIYRAGSLSCELGDMDFKTLMATAQMNTQISKKQVRPEVLSECVVEWVSPRGLDSLSRTNEHATEVKDLPTRNISLLQRDTTSQGLNGFRAVVICCLVCAISLKPRSPHW